MLVQAGGPVGRTFEPERTRYPEKGTRLRFGGPRRLDGETHPRVRAQPDLLVRPEYLAVKSRSECLAHPPIVAQPGFGEPRSREEAPRTASRIRFSPPVLSRPRRVGPTMPLALTDSPVLLERFATRSRSSASPARAVTGGCQPTSTGCPMRRRWRCSPGTWTRTVPFSRMPAIEVGALWRPLTAHCCAACAR